MQIPTFMTWFDSYGRNFMKILIAFLLGLSLVSCKPDSKSNEPVPRQLSAPEVDDTVYKVVWYADETKEESICRWYKNIMSRRGISLDVKFQVSDSYLRYCIDTPQSTE